jgi:heme/copper-type cytochrome/quinol oxidase subunit 3
MNNVVPLNARVLSREKAREHTGAIGMMVALGAWGMMFASLFFAYLGLRSQAKSWPPPGIDLPVLVPALNTVVMLASSVTLSFALTSLRGGVRTKAVRWTALTFALGVVFVALQAGLWRSMWLGGINFTTGVVGAVVYALTILHALHVVGGMAVLGYLLVLAFRGAQLHRKASTLRYCGMYWHFVDAVWFLMFVGMFLL